MVHHFPYDVEEELGEVRFFEEECPGVYYLSCCQDETSFLCREFYIVEETAAAIPSGVKRMGRRLLGCPNLLAFEIENISGGQKIVAYEVSKFRIIHGLPLADGMTLRSIAMDGMETNPEYFGTFPVPFHTPWGQTLRHAAIDNGVYWIETAQCRRVLAVYGILHDTLSDAARKLATRECSSGEGDCVTDYFFFPKEASCIPIFELMQIRRHWENSCINRIALENAIWRYYPEYAANYNAQEATGQHNMISLLINSMGEDMELAGSEEQMIALSPDAGTDFCTLLD